MSQHIEQLRAARNAAKSALDAYHENRAEKLLARDTARAALNEHISKAEASRAELKAASAELAAAVGNGAAEADRAKLRNRTADLRAAIEHHEAEAAEIQAALPRLEEQAHHVMQTNGPIAQFHNADFNLRAREWVEALAEIAPRWFALSDAARLAQRDVRHDLNGLAINPRQATLAGIHFDFPQG